MCPSTTKRTLREEALRILHSGYCGVTGMSDQARELMFWPGMLQDIGVERGRCKIYTRTAPSQAAPPPTALKMAEYLFQHVVTLYLQLGGHLYYIFCCRYSVVKCTGPSWGRPRSSYRN
jgi:hypothetical protein